MNQLATNLIVAALLVGLVLLVRFRGGGRADALQPGAVDRLRRQRRRHVLRLRTHDIGSENRSKTDHPKQHGLCPLCRTKHAATHVVASGKTCARGIVSI